MNIQEKFEYWLDIAQYDLSTADAMLAAGRWLYVVFMCQERLSVSLKEDEAKQILDMAKEAFTWLLTLKP